MAEHLQRLLEKRILMVSGKGGVGKTTVTALLARTAAAQGRRVLAVDIDKELESPSVLLQMLCGQKHFVNHEPYEVSYNLHCARLSPRVGQHDFLREHIPVGLLANAAIRSKQLNRFLMAAPGFQETGIIYRLMVFLRRELAKETPRYELVLVDLPATGHALALTSLPQPLLRVFPSGPIERSIRESQSYFNDSKKTSCLVVTLPESLPVSETFELVGGLRRDQMEVAGVLMNRVPQDPLTGEEREGVRSFFDAHPNELTGAWSLSRLSRSEQAILQLKKKIEASPPRLPVWMLEEWHGGQGPEMLDELQTKIREESWSFEGEGEKR